MHNKHIKERLDQTTIEVNHRKYDSYFDEEVKDYIIIWLKYMAITIFSLGLAYPWAKCLKLRAKYHHTVVCGRRLKFIGEPIDLARYWVWWFILTNITLGIFALFTHIRMEKWVAAHVVYDDTEIV